MRLQRCTRHLQKKPKKKGKKRREKRRRPKAESSGEGKQKGSLVANVLGASPYTILLAISLAAVTIAVFYMALQLIAYEGDYGAKAAKQAAAAPASARFVEPTRFDVA